MKEQEWKASVFFRDVSVILRNEMPLISACKESMALTVCGMIRLVS